MTFYALDPLRGKGAKLGQIARQNNTGVKDWGMSPDGARVAITTVNGSIEILSVRDGTWHEIVLGPDWQRPRDLAWSVDGKGFFVTHWAPDSFDLIYVALTGAVSSLVHNGRRFEMGDPLPSPDGKYLALRTSEWDSNLWMIENF